MPDNQAHSTAIAELQAKATSDLRAANGRPDSLREAIVSYLLEGCRLGLVSSELTDFFCISTPSIVEAAGYTGSASDAVVALFDELHDQLRRSRG